MLESSLAGATRADYGLELAEKNIKTSGRADAKKIVVFFTDGKPTSYSEFDSDVANCCRDGCQEA
ncbi:MAG: hypothetical protein ACLUSU_05905 [Collinsella sp.]